MSAGMIDWRSVSRMNLLTELLDHSMLVEDRQLLAADRAADKPAPVTVINTSGAGGMLALAGRSPAKLAVIAVDNTVRDPLDPATNIARIAAAARELDPDILVRVAIPPECRAYDEAVAAVEAEGLEGLIDAHQAAEQIARALAAFVEADLPFAATVSDATELVGLLLALDEVIDGAPPEQAVQTLTEPISTERVRIITGWDDQHVARIRRRLTAVRATDYPALLEELAAI